MICWLCNNVRLMRRGDLKRQSSGVKKRNAAELKIRRDVRMMPGVAKKISADAMMRHVSKRMTRDAKKLSKGVSNTRNANVRKPLGSPRRPDLRQ